MIDLENNFTQFIKENSFKYLEQDNFLCPHILWYFPEVYDNTTLMVDDESLDIFPREDFNDTLDEVFTALFEDKISVEIDCKFYGSDKIFILDNLYASVSYEKYLETYKEESKIAEFGLLLLKNTGFNSREDFLGEFLKTEVRLVGLEAEKQHNVEMRDLWKRLDNNMPLLFDLPNSCIVEEDEKYVRKPWFNFETYSESLLGAYRAERFSNRKILSDKNRKIAKKKLRNKFNQLEKDLNKINQLYEKDFYKVEKIFELVRNRYEV